MAGPDIKKMVFSIVMLLATKKFVDSENETHVLCVRILYLSVQLGCIALIGFIYMKASKSVEPGLVSVKEELPFGEEGERPIVKKTIAEHDTNACIKEIQRIGLGLCVTCFIHYKWGFVPPLVLQSFVLPMGFYNTPIAKVYLRGLKAWGELRRPWADPTSSGNKMLSSGSFKSISDTWNSAMHGTPIIKKSNKVKREAKGGKKKK